MALGAAFAGDAEVAEFDGAGAGEEDVGGFDVWNWRSAGGTHRREVDLDVVQEMCSGSNHIISQGAGRGLDQKVPKFKPGTG